MTTTGWKETGSYREYPYRNTPHPKEKVEPYGFVKNQRLYKKAYTERTLSREPLALLGYIVAHCNANGECYLSLSKISKEQGVSRQAIQNRITPILREGYIIRERGQGSLGGYTCNTYRLNFDCLKEEDCPELTEISCMDAICPLFSATFDVIDSASMGENHGSTDTVSGILCLREDVYEGALQGTGRDRMTLMHEVGHLLLHTPDRVILNRNFSEKIPTYMHPEWQAKCFAAEFLIPFGILNNGMDIIDVAEHCGVSYDAANYQLQQYKKEGLIKMRETAGTVSRIESIHG